MDFQQAEKKFKQLKAQFTTGILSETEFKTQLEELMVQDEQGSWWMIGYETEQWFRHDGTEWVQIDPPGSPSQKHLSKVSSESDVTESNSLNRADQEIADKVEKAEHEVSKTVINKRQNEPKQKKQLIQKTQKVISSFLQNNEIVIPNSNKKPVLALFLSYFSGGGGQIYLGQTKKGIVLILASILINSATVLLTIPLISAICATDAYCIAQKIKKGQSVKEWEFGFSWKLFLKVFLYVVVPIVVIGIILLILSEYM